MLGWIAAILHCNTIAFKFKCTFLLIREYHNENRIEDTNYGQIEKTYTAPSLGCLETQINKLRREHVPGTGRNISRTC